MSDSQMRWWESRRNLGFTGTLAVGLVLSSAVGIFGLIPVGRWFASAWRLVSYPIPVPLTILVGLVVALLVAVVGAVRRAVAPPPPPFLSYTEDNLLGIVWRWRYFDNQIVETSLMPYCPRCQTRLRGEQHGYMETTTAFICDECRFTQQIPGNGNQVLERVVRIIEREANTRAQSS